MRRSGWVLVLLASVMQVAEGAAQARSFFVVTGSAATQAAAQEQAALTGGWALDTDLYEGLKPGLFVVVRGPFQRKSDAEKELAAIKRAGELDDAYVKEAGSSRLPASIGEELGPHALAALLGELRADVSVHPGGENPCEPQEPYRAIRLSYVALERTGPDSFEPKRRDVDLGGFWIIERTGEIERMRVCAE